MTCSALAGALLLLLRNPVYSLGSFYALSDAAARLARSLQVAALCVLTFSGAYILSMRWFSRASAAMLLLLPADMKTSQLQHLDPDLVLLQGPAD